MEVIGGNDPFLSGRVDDLVDCVPDVGTSDVIVWLVSERHAHLLQAVARMQSARTCTSHSALGLSCLI